MKIGSRTFDFKKPVIMGIMNITPDSFSDGGLYNSPGRATAHAKRLIQEGADILDVGGESTRPGSKPVHPSEEVRRVVPVIKRIRSQSDIPISIDTRKARIAREAIEAGADMVNDVSAGCNDPEMFDVVARTGVPICLMHMKGTPDTMQLNPTYEDLIGEIIDFLEQRIETAEKAGIATDRIIIDPGIGFGKAVQDNLDIIMNIDKLSQLGKPILLGPSRKSFIGKLLHLDLDQRLEPTLATLWRSFEKGAKIFRVHDVGAVHRYLSMHCLMSTS